MTRRAYPGIQVQRHKRPDGTWRVHRYHRQTRTMLPGEPGSMEFDLAYALATKKASKLPKRRKPRFVYFFQCVTLRHIKIGSSCAPYERFVHTQSHCPDDVVLLGVVPDTVRSTLEHELHKRFRAHRLRGEWFRECDELHAFIKNHAKPARMDRAQGGIA